MGLIKKFAEFETELETELEDVVTPEIEAQNAADLEEQKLTDRAQEYVSNKIAKLKKEGYPDDQATAIAFSMAKDRGFDVGGKSNEEEEEEDAIASEEPANMINENMVDEITINLRALDEEGRQTIADILDKQLNMYPDDKNDAALEILNNFKED